MRVVAAGDDDDDMARQPESHARLVIEENSTRMTGRRRMDKWIMNKNGSNSKLKGKNTRVEEEKHCIC
jgi:hypothetical protein